MSPFTCPYLILLVLNIIWVIFIVNHKKGLHHWSYRCCHHCHGCHNPHSQSFPHTCPDFLAIPRERVDDLDIHKGKHVMAKQTHRQTGQPIDLSSQVTGGAKIYLWKCFLSMLLVFLACTHLENFSCWIRQFAFQIQILAKVYII